MKSGNKLTWKILTEDERSSLLLSINYNKSTWQAGEIMNKAHYKYLEIQARARNFFKIFNEYFVVTGNLRIPKDCILDNSFRDFIILTIFERKTVKQAVTEMGNSPFIVSKVKERILTEQLDMLQTSDNPNHQLLYDLIMEFDRWNNFRILPISLQEPSAFKRRNKTRLIKHLKNLVKLDEYYVRRFIKRFKATTKDKTKYIPIFSLSFEGGYEVIKVKRTKKIIGYISKHLRLYVFNSEEEADAFGYMVTRYLNRSDKDCKVGQLFWPKYRKAIEQAYNYLEVNNIIPRRKYLEEAFMDLDNIRIKKMTNNLIKDVSDAQKRVSSKKLWNI